MVLVAMAFVAGALLIALISLSPSPDRLRVPQRAMVGLDRSRHQVQRRLRVSEALEQHEWRVERQRAVSRLAVAAPQPALARDEWSQPDPAVGVRRSFTMPMQPIAPFWQNWTPEPAGPAGFGPPPPGYYYAPLPFPKFGSPTSDEWQSPDQEPQLRAS